WIEKPLNTDSEELFKARTPRNEIVDHMLEDLDYAVENLQLKGSSEANRLNKETALAFKSRIALYEGTWEKYHQGTEFGVANSNVQKYLEEAADAAKQLIDLGTAEIYSTGDPYHDYWNLFNKVDYSDNSEVLLWKKYDVSLGLYHNLDRYIPKLGQKGGLSKALVDDYLMDSGIPISASSRYQGDGTLSDVVENRDPRLHQTVWIPGDTTKIKNGEVTVFERPLLWETGSA
ncbi:MAG: RagB/SusD family nutrient uptake outer membrane protein, partial [Aliifodinibius sp.]|nr:RagB/SusD family nutrient uptake outer membrane protein [Fodinibius sp.]